MLAGLARRNKRPVRVEYQASDGWWGLEAKVLSNSAFIKKEKPGIYPFLYKS